MWFQVELLIGYLHDDARFAVKRRALADLRYLASAERAHLWSEANVAAVIAFARKGRKFTNYLLFLPIPSKDLPGPFRFFPDFEFQDFDFPDFEIILAPRF